MRAENYIGLGYQRLLTFEVKGGGFSLFGSPPASVMLSAKGLLELNDMSKVYPVDPAIIERTRNWLLSNQKPDGTWDGTAGWDHPPEGNGDPMPLTAIVAWALVEAGGKDTAGVGRSISYLRANAGGAEDAYTLSLIANALVAFDPGDSTTQTVLSRLDGMRVTEGETSYWASKTGSFTGATGVAGNVETTALAAYAFLRARAYPDSTQRALTYLIQKKSPDGTWGSTQATILALRALTESVFATGETTQDATVTVSFNGAQANPIRITRENSGVVQLLTFDDVNVGENRIAFQVDGKGSFAYQVTASYYLPWDAVPPTPETDKAVDIQVAYDRTTLSVDDQVGVTTKVRLNKSGTARMLLVDLGVPPGFTVMTEDLDAAVELKTISRYEVTGRQIILYLENLTTGKPLTVQYHLKARFPLRAKTPASTSYDYYNPSVVGTQAPQQLTVN